MKSSGKGFTIIEVLLTSSILALVLCGLLLVYVNLLLLGDISRKMTLAANAAQAKLEEIKNITFENLDAENGDTFDVPGFNASDARGLVQVSGTGYSDLKKVRIVVSFRQKGTRVIGEDKNLNGSLDSGEDVSSPNGQLDSPVELITLIAK